MSSEFSDRVYTALLKIPLGKVSSYKALAEYINSRAYRAVGRSLSLNPNAPEVPCHRIVCADGSVGGYSAASGIKDKIKLLKAEGLKIKDNKIVDFKDKFFDFRNCT